MKHLIGKIVKVTYNHPAPSGSSRDAMPNVGRVVKFYKSEDRILVANPECLTEEDVSSKGADKGLFKWGYWVDLDDANIEVQPQELVGGGVLIANEDLKVDHMKWVVHDTGELKLWKDLVKK